MELTKDQLDCVSGGTGESTGMEERIYQIIADNLDRKPNSFTSDSILIDDLGADAYDLLDIVSRIEAAFCIRIPESEMYRFRTVDDLVQYVRMHI